MSDLEEHCKRTMKRYGVEGRDIHSWLDEPSKAYTTAHRQFKHDTERIRMVGEIFGKTYGKSLAENIALDHIILDHEEEMYLCTKTQLQNSYRNDLSPTIKELTKRAIREYRRERDKK